jgi:hypothetical protein
VGNQVSTVIDSDGLQGLADLFGGIPEGPNANQLVRKRGPGRDDSRRAQKFQLQLERDITVGIPNAAAAAGDAVIEGMRCVPGGNSGVEFGRLLAGEGSAEDFVKALPFDLFFADEVQKLFHLGMARPTLGATNAAPLLVDQHHPLPRFLGGDATQVLSRLDQKTHQEFHILLRRRLKGVGIPLNVGGRGGTYRDWANYMNQNPGAQRKAFDAVLDTCRAIDVKHGTTITQDVWNNIMQGHFTPHP